MLNETRLNVGLMQPERISVKLLDGRNSQAEKLSVRLSNSGGGTRNYNNLVNKPSINGVVLQGDVGIADLGLVSENTSEGWEEMHVSYVPKQGEICIYSDTGRMKVGDGSVPLIDLPFIGKADVDQVAEALRQHTENASVHVSAEDRARWDNKLNCTVSQDVLVLNRL